MGNDYITRYINTNGKKRKIITYSNSEKRNEHIEIKKFLENELSFSKFTKAYIPKSSIFKNAKAHMYNDIFVKYDISNFFNNIDHYILVTVLHQQLNYKYGSEKYSLLEVSELVSECIYYNKGLPLGLITSPILANIYLKNFDNIIYGKLKRLGLDNVIYTRYADDLTISFKNPTNEDISFFNEKIKKIEFEVTKFLKKYKLKINIKKKSIISFKKSNHVRVTGISIIKQLDGKRTLSVGKKRITKLFDEALELFIEINDKCDLTPLLRYKIERVKGLESFILSIHKKGYDHIFSRAMNNKINDLGFKSLNELINSFDKYNHDR